MNSGSSNGEVGEREAAIGAAGRELLSRKVETTTTTTTPAASSRRTPSAAPIAPPSIFIDASSVFGTRNDKSLLRQLAETPIENILIGTQDPSSTDLLKYKASSGVDESLLSGEFIEDCHINHHHLDNGDFSGFGAVTSGDEAVIEKAAPRCFDRVVDRKHHRPYCSNKNVKCIDLLVCNHTGILISSGSSSSSSSSSSGGGRSRSSSYSSINSSCSNSSNGNDDITSSGHSGENNVGESINSNSASRSRVCSERPVFLMKTHINCERGKIIKDIEKSVMSFLSQWPQAAVKYDSTHYNWNVHIVSGRSTCLLEMSIFYQYDNKCTVECESEKRYIVEVNKIKGSSEIHHEFFRVLQVHISPSDSGATSSTLSSSTSPPMSPLPLFDTDTTDSFEYGGGRSVANHLYPTHTLSVHVGGGDTYSISKAICHIFQLALSSDINELLAVSEFMCEYCDFNTEFMDFIVENDVSSFAVFHKLLCTGIVEIQRNTVFTLKALVDCQSFQGMLITYDILSNIFSIASSYTMASCETIDICRSCAFIIFNVMNNYSKASIACLGIENIERWIVSTKTLYDQNLQFHVSRISASLNK